MFEQKFVFSLVVFCSHAAVFWIGVFSKLFSNPFIVRSRPSFLFEPKILFLLVVFCSHAAF